MKKTLVIFFLFLTFLKIGGFVAILGITREIIRKQVFQKIKDKVVVADTKCIVGTTENLKKIIWEKENKEFWFDGELYDLIRIEDKHGVKHYFCLSDKNEKQIIATMDNLIIGNNHSPINQTSKDILVLIFQPAIIITYLTASFKVTVSDIFTKFPPILSFYNSPYSLKSSPPPKILSK